jgi:predicted DCC family thiol-disulfide oxidoreductase YuxK
MPDGIFLVAWLLLALGYSYSGLTKLASPSWLDGTAMERVLQNPLARPGWLRDLLLTLPNWILRAMTWGALAAEIAFAPLALVRSARPWIWLVLLLMHCGLIMVVDFTDLSLGMIMIHLFTFDPAWIPAQPATGTDVLFFDGSCGLCHRAVRFILAEDRSRMAFRFAPLGGETFAATIPQSDAAKLPDSLVVATTDGRLVFRARAVRRIARKLGGIWRLIAITSSIIPTVVLDFGYNLIARIRYRLFARPKQACPILPKELRERFLP